MVLTCAIQNYMPFFIHSSCYLKSFFFFLSLNKNRPTSSDFFPTSSVKVIHRDLEITHSIDLKPEACMHDMQIFLCGLYICFVVSDGFY